MQLHPTAVFLTLIGLTGLFAVAAWPLLRELPAKLRTAQMRHTYIHTTIREWVIDPDSILRTSSSTLSRMVPRPSAWADEIGPTTAYGWAPWSAVSRIGPVYILNLNGDIAQHWSPTHPVLVVYDESSRVWHFGLFGEKRDAGSYEFLHSVEAKFAGVYSSDLLADHVLAG